MLRIGVIGAAGFMGRNHARNLKALYDLGHKVQLCALSDINPQVNEVAETFGVTAYQDYREMLVKTSLDAVVVSVPTVLHCQISCDALEAGLHVMVEKPIASSVEEADEMVSLARRCGKILMVGHIEWFNPVVCKLVLQIAQGIFGDILMIEAKRLNPFPKGRDEGVGVAVDLATHDIFNVLQILERMGKPFYGKPLAVGGSSTLTSSFEDYISMFLPADGTVAEITASWLHPFKVRKTTVVGTCGTVVADLVSREMVFYPTGEGYDTQGDMNAALYDITFTERRIPQIPNRRVEPMRLELEEFVSAILEDRQPAVTGDAALDALRIALEASHQVLARQGGVR